ncbi:ECF RNA polymerase sigma factor SigE [Roseimaritima multifibrata]|uniref:ECF RNA polymerase sigma factor SigE n=1 Tax=Roseimaritima multifibrata TaxID=1930274 RepID=A0A517MKA6_9BACT|nr:sigma-70 family RNA polymerase sigma factor [Roseimaritima multifibrata]QDS95313.1 ECF RNA polymerase sigma factor SigE [Roseimaritima multifibrata]
MNRESATPPSLLRGLRCRDEISWNRLVDLFGPLVYSLSRRSGLGHEAAADVMQETFLSVNQSLPKFQYRNSDDTFRGWLCRIAQFRIADYQRRRTEVLSAVGGSAMRDRLEATSDHSSTIAAPTDSEWKGVVQRAAALVQSEFSQRSWQAFWLTTVGGQSATDAALELGMQSAAVRKAKSRVARRLREVLGEIEELGDS